MGRRACPGDLITFALGPRPTLYLPKGKLEKPFIEKISGCLNIKIKALF